MKRKYLKRSDINNTGRSRYENLNHFYINTAIEITWSIKAQHSIGMIPA